MQARIAAVRTEREKAVATRRDPITGTSEFPDIRETAVSVLIPAPAPSPRTRGEAESPQRPREGAVQDEALPDTSPHPRSPRFRPDKGPESSPHPGRGGAASLSNLIAQAGQGASLDELAASAPGVDALAASPLPAIRAAEPFERLRDRSDAVLAETGARPKVFLANLGPVAAFTTRATFAKNFFEAGGLKPGATRSLRARPRSSGRGWNGLRLEEMRSSGFACAPPTPSMPMTLRKQRGCSVTPA